MAIGFDPGYTKRPWTTLAGDPPGAEVYPPGAFRVEWGPIFHRGRLDGTARLLLVGQDPAQHEAVCRRVLVGEAGQRIQGFLAKLGVTTSYVMMNTFLYSVYGQRGGERHIGDEAITAYRNRWLDALVARNDLDAIITLGQLARSALDQWKETDGGRSSTAPVVPIVHPTYPDSASRSRQPGAPTFAQAMRQLCRDWNKALDTLAPIVTADEAIPLVRYGTTIKETDHGEIPAGDLPAGLPAWMRSPRQWADRKGANAEEKRANITITIPPPDRPW
jgi:uracil-DNA glycosylase